MIDESSLREALERIAADRWCSGDDLRDLARKALGLPVDTDDTCAVRRGSAPDMASISAALKCAYEGRVFDLLSYKNSILMMVRR